MKSNFILFIGICFSAFIFAIDLQGNQLINEKEEIIAIAGSCGGSGATVSCRDVEHYQDSYARNRSRICVDTNNDCLCDWKYHSKVGTLGTCSP